MNKIIEKTRLNPTVSKMVILAPEIARKALPGQFVILRADEQGERIPLTVSDTAPENGTVTVVYQIVGATTLRLDTLESGDYICDFVGPLGKATELDNIKKAAVIGGGVGCAIAYPIAKKLHEQGAVVHTVAGFRTRDLVIFQDEFCAVSSVYKLMTDDGSAGEKGLVTNALQTLIESGESYDSVFTIGPLVMMKFVCALTKKYGIKTVVSMNPIMIDGTGMCGCCRITVGGKMKFACVDGPDFDGFEVDFDEAISRCGMYKQFERKAYEDTCNLLNKRTN